MSNNETKFELSYESAVERLEEIVNLLEKGDAPLEESLDLFREGVTLAKACEEKLSALTEEISKIQLGPEGKLIETKVEFPDA
ncbi:MAG: exodeoxyribonuclease VII small subunit [Saccharofermentanales bacterium]|jgi:exodeoxyribonuclease VII small subunit|nr:exodeoxyribonuclease VII small subunit [Bacillota bacterium]NLB08324.1 exodeoxyribonuclease VII small subunit [Clostridiales bacterium]